MKPIINTHTQNQTIFAVFVLYIDHNCHNKLEKPLKKTEQQCNSIQQNLQNYTGKEKNPSVNYKRWNSRTAFLVEVSGHKPESSQPRIFV